MATETTEEKKTRTPRDYSSIEKGALALELAERVKLRDELTKSINEEIKLMEEKLAGAKQLLNGK